MGGMIDDRPAGTEEQVFCWGEWVKRKVEFYITSKQWDNITISSLNSWLNNFDELGKRHAFPLLNQFIYYSERDVKRLAYFALTRVVFKDHFLALEERNEFRSINDELKEFLFGLLQNTAIVPIWSEGNPSESGNTIARIYTTTSLVSQQQVIRPDQILPAIYNGAYGRFLFVDDFLGSGEQIINFWNTPLIALSSSGDKVPLSRIAKHHPDLTFEYVALVASSYGLQRVQSSCLDLILHTCEELTDEYRIFSDNSLFFNTKQERKESYLFLKELSHRKGIGFLGYHDLDYAIAFHHGAPDSCLPLFWEQKHSWNQLVRRRM